MTNTIKTVALAIIATCYMANTVAIYSAEGGGTNLCAGNFCYHIEGEL